MIKIHSPKCLKLLSIALLSCASASIGTPTSAASKTFIYCSESSPEGFDPALYSSNSTWDASSETIYDRLIEFNPGTTEVISGLAKSWTISDDNTEYTFKLRQGVKFHTTPYFTPTRNFNADDVVFTYKRQLDKKDLWYNYAGVGNWLMFDGMEMPSTIKEIVKINDQTVKFVLAQPDAAFLAKLALNYGSIMSKEYADKLSASNKLIELDQKPVGTGPFAFVAYQQDAAIRYSANPVYWAGKPKIENLVFAITLDPATRTQRLKAGECHMAPYPLPADVQNLKADPNLRVEEQAGLNVSYLAYNNMVAPFDKLDVRRALNMAINRQAIVKSVYQGMGQIAKNAIPPTMWGYNDTIVDYPYDPTLAKKMLEEAGVEDLKMKIWAMPVSRPYMPNARRTAELIQADLANIGVKVEILSYEWGEYLKKAKDKNRDGAVILGATSDNGDPDNMLSFFFACSAVGASNISNWCFKSVDDGLRKARTTLDKDQRSDIYKQMQRDIHDQAPWLAIAHSKVILPMSKKVKGYVMEPLGSHRFKNVDLED